MKRRDKFLYSAFATVGATTALATFGVSAGINLMVRNITHPKRNPFIDRSQFEELNLPHEDVAFENLRDGLTIRGTLVKPESTNKVVILGHGYGGNRTSNQLAVSLANELHKRGIATLLMDYRNCGESDKGISGLGVNEKIDTHYASKFLLEEYGFTEQALAGVSQAGATSLVAGAENPFIKGVVVDTAFYDQETYLRQNAHKWIGEKIPPQLLNLLMAKDGEQIKPEIMDILIRRLKSRGIDPQEMQPFRAMKVLKSAKVPVDLWSHELDDKIPPEDNTKALADIHGTYHPFTGEPQRSEPVNKEHYHAVSHHVLGDNIVQEMTIALERGLNLDRQRAVGDWIERLNHQHLSKKKHLSRSPKHESQKRRRLPRPLKRSPLKRNPFKRNHEPEIAREN